TSSKSVMASTLSPRTTARKAPIPVLARPRRRATPSRSSFSPAATAARLQAASSPRPDAGGVMSATWIHARSIPAKAGIGLRFQHHQIVVDERPDVAWMEVHTENYMGGGTPLRFLDAIRRDSPISLHGVGLSLGSAAGLDPAHLERIRRVAERIEPGLLSEH